MAADGEQQQQQPLTARVPRQGAVAIQYPGYIASVDAALASLGGLEGLGRGLQERAGLLKLRLRPEDSHSHPLLGERQHVAGLVLRIARPRDQPGAPPSMTIAARVAQAHAFTGLADYQFLGDDGPWGGGRDASRLSARNEGGGAEPFGAGAARPLLLVPPLFSKVDAPLVFGFRDQAPSRGAVSGGNPGCVLQPALQPELTARQQRRLQRLHPNIATLHPHAACPGVATCVTPHAMQSPRRLARPPAAGRASFPFTSPTCRQACRCQRRRPAQRRQQHARRWWRPCRCGPDAALGGSSSAQQRCMRGRQLQGRPDTPADRRGALCATHTPAGGTGGAAGVASRAAAGAASTRQQPAAVAAAAGGAVLPVQDG